MPLKFKMSEQYRLAEIPPCELIAGHEIHSLPVRRRRSGRSFQLMQYDDRSWP